MDEDVRMTRNELFQELKPYCVNLSQLALKNDGSPDGLKALREAVLQLLTILGEKCMKDDKVFDEKLAEYVFFPLSHVLKRCQKTPGRLAELAVQCVRLLLLHGWRQNVPLELAIQMMLLLTFFAGGGGPSNTVISEELKTHALSTLATLFQAIRQTPKGSTTLIATSTVPALGHCLSTILEGITDGPTPQCQIEAVMALQSLWSAVKDQQALSNFLPGTISALTRSMTPTTQSFRSRKFLIHALGALQNVLTSSLSDIRTRNVVNVNDTPNGEKQVLTKAWLSATASQVKIALANIVKLRNHDNRDVQLALARLCLVLLDECHDSLAGAAAILVETLMDISSKDNENDYVQQQSLKDLAMVHGSIFELIKSTVYKWVTSFPRIMQSNDEPSKGIAMQKLAKAYDLMSELSIDSSVLEEAIGDSLRDGVASIIDLSGSQPVTEESQPPGSGGVVSLARDTVSAANFKPIIMPQESQKKSRDQLEQMLRSLGPAESKLRLASSMLPRLTVEGGPSLMGSFWLSFQLLKASMDTSEDFEDFLVPALTNVTDKEVLMDELYDISLSFISEEDSIDWRLQAIGLEVVAYRATHLKLDFRSDLVDTLYPVVQLFGSPNSQLKTHAITCLNIISTACGYDSTSGMITENVDYLVNAVSLKLNTFDISPAAPQVLVMMIKLSGPTLLPYLDDVVESIFAALDNFHGYPRLVESLFSVLGEIVDEGSKSGQLQLTAAQEIDHRKKPPEPPTGMQIADLLKRSMSRKSARDKDISEDFPRKPWKSARELLDEKELAEGMDEGDDKQDDPMEISQDVLKQPPTKVYSMLQSIARLGQHYLTSQSPYLRRKLLELVSTACSALYRNEDQFLPLLNDIWPVLIKRLYDEEPFVVIAAASTIAEVCRCAGDFMATRIQSEWAYLIKAMGQAKSKALAEKKGRHARGVYAQNSQIWEGFIALLIAIVEYVRVSEEMFDGILALMGDVLATRDDVRNALQLINADAVWLEELRQGKNLGQVPQMEGYMFAGA